MGNREGPIYDQPAAIALRECVTIDSEGNDMKAMLSKLFGGGRANMDNNGDGSCTCFTWG